MRFVATCYATSKDPIPRQERPNCASSWKINDVHFSTSYLSFSAIIFLFDKKWIALIMSIAVYNVQTYLDLYLYIFSQNILKLCYIYVHHIYIYIYIYTVQILIFCTYLIAILSWISLKHCARICIKSSIHHSFLRSSCSYLLDFYTSYMYIATVTIYWRLK